MKYKLNSDKSLSIRFILYSTLGIKNNNDFIYLKNITISKDVLAAINFIKQIGYNVDFKTNDLIIRKNKYYQKKDLLIINCYNSATVFRIGLGLLDFKDYKYVYIYGDESLKKRSMTRIFKTLNIKKFMKYNNGYILQKFDNNDNFYKDEFNSAQLTSSYIIHKLRKKQTARIMSNFNFRNTNDIVLKLLFKISITSDAMYKNYHIIDFRLKQNEYDLKYYADPSSAIFLFALALRYQKNIKVDNILWDPNRIKYLEYFKNNIIIKDNSIFFNYKNNLTFNKVEKMNSNLIDEIPVIIILASLYGNLDNYTFTNLKELENKESNRLLATIDILNLLGSKPKYNYKNDLLTFKKTKIKKIKYKSYDHRIYMLIQIINDLENPKNYNNVSFPDFNNLAILIKNT